MIKLNNYKKIFILLFSLQSCLRYNPNFFAHNKIGKVLDSIVLANRKSQDNFNVKIKT